MALVAHRTQTGLNAAHPPFYASESDPTTTLGAHRVWLKPSTGVIKRRNAANTAWDDISIEGTSAGSAPSLADLSDVDVITTPPGDGEALVWDDTAGEWVPGSVAAGSLAASDVTYAGGTGMSATNVETAIDELAIEKANDAALTAHIDDIADAHDATAISYAGGTGMSATHVEGAIDELATEKANDSALTAHIGDTSDAHDASAISILDTAAQYTATEVEGALAEVLDGLQAHEADATDAHDASAISVLDTANQYTATNVESALAEVLDEVQAHEADATDAHDATAISFSPAGSIAATNVQAAIEEAASEAGGGGSAHVIQDEGTPLTQRANLSFEGAGVTVTDDSGDAQTVVTIPGGGGGSGNISGAYDIEAGTYTDVGMSDEFASGTLDAKWTVIAGSSGTIDFPGQPASGVYDLTTRSGTLLLQPTYSSSTQEVYFRQADGLAVGESLVASVGLPKVTGTTQGTVLGLYFNSSTTSLTTGTWRGFALIASLSGTNSGNPTVRLNGNTGDLAVYTAYAIVGPRVYMRKTRKTVAGTDTDFYFYSLDGVTWIQVHAENAVATTHFWLYTATFANTARTSPVYTVNWVRHVASTAHDLW